MTGEKSAVTRIRAWLGRGRDGARKIAKTLFPERLADRFLLRPLAMDPQPRETILIAPPSANNEKFSGGNIGDRAMVESFLDNVAGPIRIISSGVDDWVLPDRFVGRVTIEPLPRLIYGWGVGNVLAMRTLRRRLAGARHLAVVGADIMDGAYNPHASTCRARVARLAASVGVDSRVLGFSWNGRPHPGAAAAIGRAGESGAKLLLRDPISYGRAESEGLAGIVEVADTVFAARHIDTAPLHSMLGPDPRPYALVNVSALVGRTVEQAVEYDPVVDDLLGRGLQVVLLPHVSRLESDDIKDCRAVFERHHDKDVVLVDHLLDPAGILGLCSRAAVVITGRMHLSIMSLNSGVPAIALATQGKVEGLFQLFGISSNCVNPVPGFGQDVVAAIGRSLDEPDVLSGIDAALAAVRLLAARNFEGMPLNDLVPSSAVDSHREPPRQAFVNTATLSS